MMITFKEIAERIDKSTENEGNFNIYELDEDLGIYSVCSLTNEKEFEEKNKKKIELLLYKESLVRRGKQCYI